MPTSNKAAAKTMNDDVKTKWLDALRSGEYEQGRGRLRITPKGQKKMCCLGVLCDLYADEVGGRWTSSKGYADVFVDERGNRSDFGLPMDVRRWAGLAEPHVSPEVRVSAEIEGGPATPLLSQMNDGDGMREHSFDEIADVIETHL